MDISFPENIKTTRQGTRPIKLSHLLGLVYCFGGFAGVLSLLSKFVIAPLFEELTYERRLLIEEVRNRLLHLNTLLSRTVVPSKPGKPYVRSHYVEHLVYANDSMPQPPADPYIEARATEMIEKFRNLLSEFGSIDPNDETLQIQSSLTGKAEELSKYSRSIQYETIPSSIFAASMSRASSATGTAGAKLGEAVLECQKEIRSFKSYLLS